MVREDGGRGEEKAYAVELRVMAHVGLVSYFFSAFYCISNDSRITAENLNS